MPFLESPKYAPQRRESTRTLMLPHPHPFLRANSDNSMTVPEWMAVPSTTGNTVVSVQVCLIRKHPFMYFYVLKMILIQNLPQNYYLNGPHQGLKHSGTIRSSSSPRGARTRSPSRGRSGEKEERSRSIRSRPGSVGTFASDSPPAGLVVLRLQKRPDIGFTSCLYVSLWKGWGQPGVP